MRLSRKRWDEVAELVIGTSGKVKWAGKDIHCTVKEIVIKNEKGKPELFIVTETDKKFPIKRYTPSTEAKPIAEEDVQIALSGLQLKAAKLIKSGNARLLQRSSSGLSLYEIQLSPIQSPRQVLYNERTRRVVKLV